MDVLAVVVWTVGSPQAVCHTESREILWPPHPALGAASLEPGHSSCWLKGHSYWPTMQPRNNGGERNSWEERMLPLKGPGWRKNKESIVNRRISTSILDRIEKPSDQDQNSDTNSTKVIVSDPDWEWFETRENCLSAERKQPKQVFLLSPTILDSVWDPRDHFRRTLGSCVRAQGINKVKCLTGKDISLTAGHTGREAALMALALLQALDESALVSWGIS